MEDVLAHGGHGPDSQAIAAHMRQVQQLGQPWHTEDENYIIAVLRVAHRRRQGPLPGLCQTRRLQRPRPGFPAGKRLGYLGGRQSGLRPRRQQAMEYGMARDT
eukprot:9324774-Pyramimonas_sp.AAC.1